MDMKTNQILLSERVLIRLLVNVAHNFGNIMHMVDHNSDPKCFLENNGSHGGGSPGGGAGTAAGTWIGRGRAARRTC